jgi:hypothetical protein
MANTTQQQLKALSQHAITASFGIKPTADQERDLALATQNYLDFLARFPALEIRTRTNAVRSLILGERKPRGISREDWLNYLHFGSSEYGRLPHLDHIRPFRLKGGDKRVLIIVSHPYSHFFDEPYFQQAHEGAKNHGVQMEIAPEDVPDTYYPSQTTPIVYSLKGVDWRKLAMGGG